MDTMRLSSLDSDSSLAGFCTLANSLEYTGYDLSCPKRPPAFRGTIGPTASTARIRLVHIRCKNGRAPRSKRPAVVAGVSIECRVDCTDLCYERAMQKEEEGRHADGQ